MPSLLLIFAFMAAVGVVSFRISHVIISASKDELNSFQLACLRWILPALIALLIFIVGGLILNFIKFVVGLF